MLTAHLSLSAESLVSLAHAHIGHDPRSSYAQFSLHHSFSLASDQSIQQSVWIFVDIVS